MGIMVGLPSPSGSEKDLQLNFGKNMTVQVEMRAPHLPAEWHLQSGIQLTWPHAGTDWAYMLKEVQECFVNIAREIAKRELLLIVTPEPEEVKKQIVATVNMDNVRFLRCETNDTWARDHGAITMIDTGNPSLLDFTFNGWGMKFAANHDNLITRNLCHMKTFSGEVVPANMQPFVLEGGSIESDGKGTLMTTVECLASVNRNEYLQQEELERYLKDVFGLDRILWITSGYLAGDDTDSHVDTLARFCSEDTIAYVRCEDEEDEHYEELKAMEEEIKEFNRANGEHYRMIPLPKADKVEWEGERLPATYANFLIMNGAVLVPFYDSPKDEIAKAALREAFPDREIVGINCLPLIKQHGSLHCVTMQYPESFIE